MKEDYSSTRSSNELFLDAFCFVSPVIDMPHRFLLLCDTIGVLRRPQGFLKKPTSQNKARELGVIVSNLGGRL